MSDNQHEPGEVERLRALLRERADEIEHLRSQLDDNSDLVSRRGLVKGLGLGGLVALGVAGTSRAGSTPPVFASPGGAGEVSDLAGELPAQVELGLTGGDGRVKFEFFDITYFQSDVKSPRDAASGQATGRRQYAPVVIRKRIDKASPLLARAMAGKGGSTTATIRFFRPGQGKKNPEVFYTVALAGVEVVSIQQLLPDTNKSSGEVSTPPIEEVSFVFHTITWTYIDGGISFEDSWEGPVA